jgi:LPXTG-site transpeptidase (sortase) family protein
MLTETKILDRSSEVVPIDGAIDLKVPSGVGRDAEAVVMTVSVSGALRNGSWWLSSQGASIPIVSGRVGESASNTVIAKPSNGVLRLSTDSGGYAVVTVSGWYTGRSASSGSDGMFVAQSPLRLVDTTSSLDPLGAGVALHSNWTLENPVLGLAGVPATGVGALSVILGTTNSLGAGGTTVYAAGQARPDVKHVLAGRAGHRASTSIPVPVGDRGIAVFSAPGSDVTLDVVGWYTGAAKAAVLAKPINVMPSPDVFPGLLWVPDLRLFTSVREDTSWVNFDPSHLPESRSPNQPGNVAIFGHRTSHGREFRNLQRLKQGSLIVLAVGGRVYWYRTDSLQILSPEDPLLYTTNSNDQTLTLVACHPPGSVKFRIVARASLVSVTAP